MNVVPGAGQGCVAASDKARLCGIGQYFAPPLAKGVAEAAVYG